MADATASLSTPQAAPSSTPQAAPPSTPQAAPPSTPQAAPPSTPQASASQRITFVPTPDVKAWALTHADPDARTRSLSIAVDLGVRFLKQVDYAPPPQAAAPPVASASSSAAKGARGEDEIYALLSRTRTVRDVTRRAHSGDLVCESRAGAVYVEVKHYANTVPSAEIEKFLRDLREMDAVAGVILSLTSPIVGQRGAIRVELEPLVAAGTLVPVVYAAALHGGRLEHDVVTAAVDMAVALAEVYPRGIRGLHGRSSLLAHSVATDQLADGAAAVRAKLTRLSESVSDGLSAVGDHIARLGREARDLARAQRAEVEDVQEVSLGPSSDVYGTLSAKYTIVASRQNLGRVLIEIERISLAGGPVGSANRWKLLKLRAIHELTGCAFSFLKDATSVRVPTALLDLGATAKMMRAHPKKVRFADSEFSVELDDATVDDILGLIRPPPAPTG